MVTCHCSGCRCRRDEAGPLSPAPDIRDIPHLTIQIGTFGFVREDWDTLRDFVRRILRKRT